MNVALARSHCLTATGWWWPEATGFADDPKSFAAMRLYPNRPLAALARWLLSELGSGTGRVWVPQTFGQAHRLATSFHTAGRGVAPIVLLNATTGIFAVGMATDIRPQRCAN